MLCGHEVPFGEIKMFPNQTGMMGTRRCEVIEPDTSKGSLLCYVNVTSMTQLLKAPLK